MTVSDPQRRIREELQNLITLAQAAKLIPGRSGEGLSVCTLWRWATRGIRGHVLLTQLIGGTRYTTVAAIQNFIAATNSARSTAAVDASVDDESERKLKSAGVL
jgi:hypothetical protein